MPGLNVRKGDQVVVIAGKDRGKQGRVVRTLPNSDKVMVEGVNQVKRHEPIRQGKGRQGMEGGIITKEMPVHISTLALVCNTPECEGRARVGYVIDDDNPDLPLKRRKRRVCRKCGVTL